MDNTLFNIKARCVYANPPREFGEYDLREASDFIASRTIRLADVLIAIRKGGIVDVSPTGIRMDGVWLCGGMVYDLEEPRRGAWNLYEDDLGKQSPETIAFIGKLLGV